MLRLLDNLQPAHEYNERTSQREYNQLISQRQQRKRKTTKELSKLLPRQLTQLLIQRERQELVQGKPILVNLFVPCGKVCLLSF
jgi:hypothetical protein